MKIYFEPTGETIGRDGNAITLCGPQTGHSVKAIAFCASSEIASQILDALLFLKNEKNKKAA